MNYYELQIETAGPGVELVENELTELGIAQFVVDDPNLDIQMMDEAWVPSTWTGRKYWHGRTAAPR